MGYGSLNKAKLRRALLKTRQSMAVEEWREKSDRICQHLQASPQFTQAQTILAYFSIRQEPELRSLFKDSKQRWGFPRTVEKSLLWHSWKPGEPLQMGDYGIFEPKVDSPSLQPDDVDLILVPAVACDKQGYRLGYGGGFYDRMLSLPEWAAKPTIGIIFKLADLAELPVDEWDVKLQGVCTESGLRMTK